jgi:hypothetical protein
MLGSARKAGDPGEQRVVLTVSAIPQPVREQVVEAMLGRFPRVCRLGHILDLDAERT